KQRTQGSGRARRVVSVTLFRKEIPEPSSVANTIPATRDDDDNIDGNNNNNSIVLFTRYGSSNKVGSEALHAEITYLPTSIDRHDIFMHIVWLMIRLAPRTLNPSRVISFADLAITKNIQTIFNRAERSMPYVMNSDGLIVFLSYLPGFLVQENKFQETDIEFPDNEHAGALIAKVSSRVMPWGGVVEGIGSGNASVAIA
ncbi:MAG: hypothetical protein Q9170_003404, partial [Blastenia crenularia]